MQVSPEQLDSNKKNTRPKRFPEGNGKIVQCVEKYVMANPIDGAPSGVIMCHADFCVWCQGQDN